MQDILSFIDKIDFEKLNNFYMTMGLGKFPEILGIKKQKFNEVLKDPSARDFINNMAKDPSLFRAILNDPKTQNYIQNNLVLKLIFQNPQVILSPQNVQRSKNIFKVDEIKFLKVLTLEYLNLQNHLEV